MEKVMRRRPSVHESLGFEKGHRESDAHRESMCRFRDEALSERKGRTQKSRRLETSVSMSLLSTVQIRRVRSMKGTLECPFETEGVGHAQWQWPLGNA